MRAFSTLLISAVLTGPVLAAVPAAKMEQLLVASGLEAHIQSLAELTSASVEQGFRQSGQIEAVSAEHIGAMQSLARRDFAADTVRANVVDTLNRALTEPDADAHLAWLQSENGQAIADAEAFAGTAAGVAEMQLYIQNLQDHIPSRERIAQIESIDNTAQVAGTALSIQGNSLLVMLSAMNAVAPSELQRDFDALSALSNQLIDDAIRRDTVLQTSLQLVYTYRDIPDDALAAYLNHLESPAGNAFITARFTAMDNAMSDASAQFGGNVADLIADMPLN